MNKYVVTKHNLESCCETLDALSLEMDLERRTQSIDEYTADMGRVLACLFGGEIGPKAAIKAALPILRKKASEVWAAEGAVRWSIPYMIAQDSGILLAAAYHEIGGADDGQ